MEKEKNTQPCRFCLDLNKLFDALVRIYAARGIEITYKLEKKEQKDL